MPFIAAKRSSGGRPARWRSGLRARDATWGGGRARHEARLLPLRQRAALAAIDRLLLDRREAPLVVGDDQQDLEPVERSGRPQVRRLDDAVRVAPDIDHLTDQEALRVGRADADAELDAGRDDLVADRHDVARIDLAHDQDTAELADDLAGRRVGC